MITVKSIIKHQQTYVDPVDFEIIIAFKLTE